MNSKYEKFKEEEVLSDVSSLCWERVFQQTDYINTLVNDWSTLFSLKDKSGVDKIIVKKQPYQLLNTSREFFPSFQALNFHKFED